MPDIFSTSREFATDMRYGEDNYIPISAELLPSVPIWSHMSRAGLEITNEVVPEISELIDECCSRLFANSNGVRGFTYPGNDFQATCLRVSEEQCVIQISSALIERLKKQELAFVIGHELGHFLMNHAASDMPPQDSLEFFSQKRAQEISCDRIGLITCGGVEIAIRAIMKTMSGLGEDHIRFDAAHFLSTSIDNIGAHHDSSQIYASHPSMPIRARALLWFSGYWEAHKSSIRTCAAKESFKKMDSRVAKDMKMYVEAATKATLEKYKSEASQWIWLGAAVTDGNLSSSEQSELSVKFGDDFMVKIKQKFSQLNISQVSTFILNKAEHSIRELVSLSPEQGSKFTFEEIHKSETAFLPNGVTSVIRNNISASNPTV